MTIRTIKATLAFLFLLVLPVQALAGITVQEVEVEASAESAAKAKELALSRGEASAFDQLMGSINPAISASSVPAAKISAAIESYDIVNESMTANSYKAVVNYNFIKSKIEAIAASGAAENTSAAASETAIAAPSSNSSAGKMSGDILILAPINGIQNWNTIRKDIASVKGVTSLELIAFSLSQADVMVRFSGSLQTLAGELSAKGYNVNQQSNYWVVRK